MKLSRNLLMLIVLLIQCTFTVHANTLKLNFGIYGSERRNWVDSQNAPILRYITGQLEKFTKSKLELNTTFYPSYSTAVTALVNREIDFARFGAASYLEAKRQSPLSSIIAVESFKGLPFHEGVVAVRKDSPIQNLKDLKGNSFAFGNPKSTIGRFASQKFLVDNGITESDLKNYEYLGRHDNVAIAIIRKTHDAGAFKISILENENFNQRLRVIASFKAPAQAWVAREGMDADLLANLKKAFLSTPKEVILSDTRDAFIEGDENIYDYLRYAIENNDKFFTN